VAGCGAVGIIDIDDQDIDDQSSAIRRGIIAGLGVEEAGLRIVRKQRGQNGVFLCALTSFFSFFGEITAKTVEPGGMEELMAGKV
jgi:hypothetical protein